MKDGCDSIEEGVGSMNDGWDSSYYREEERDLWFAEG